ncbi:MAG: coenzyme F430 synthase [Thermoplasmata archaeon]|nr:coenzyme F430 synthase [Thermoplasmata archaeon]
MKALVLDMTHGGDIIARRLLGEGYEVTCVDVYRNCPEDRRREMEELEIRVTDTAPKWRYDLITLPAHCPRSFIGEAEGDRIITFSQAVGELIDDRRFRIEVTGVKGKTSACYLISKILHDSGRRVLLHSSRGEGPWTTAGHYIERNVSIAPPYLMTLPAGDYDAIVAEVSLGGSGKADIACISNLVEDYGIAKNTLKASFGKKDILCGKVNIVPENEVEFWSQYTDNLRGYRSRVKAVSEPKLGEGLRVSVDYDGITEITLDPSYVATEYLNAMDLALEVCEAVGVHRHYVLEALQSFKGVPGRGEIRREDGRTVILERNPGISRLSVARTLECLSRMGALDGAVAILDPVSRKVCDKMDADGIREEVEKYGLPLFITRGDGVFPEIPAEARILVEFVKEAYQ